MNVREFLQDYKYILCAFLLLLGYIAPFFILWDKNPALIYDNLDSVVIYYKVLAESGQIWGPLKITIPQIMNGLPRNTLFSGFNVVQIFYLVLEPYTAYVLNLATMHVVAFGGMYLLLKKYFLQEKQYEIILAGVTLAFALLPFFPNRGLAIAGMPLLLYAFLNIRDGDSSLKDWLIIGILPFYGLITHVNIFFLMGIWLLWLYDVIQKRGWNLRFFVAIILMGVMCVLVEYRLIYEMFLNPAYTSHRTEFQHQLLYSNLMSISGAFNEALHNFAFGHYHEVSFQAIGIGLAVLIALIYVQGSLKQKYPDIGDLFPFAIIGIAIVASGIAILKFSYLFVLDMWIFPWIIILILLIIIAFQVVFTNEGVTHFIKHIKYISHINPISSKWFFFIGLIFLCLILSLFFGFYWMLPVPQISGFAFMRFVCFHPLLWYVIFALALKIIVDNNKYGMTIVFLLLAMQVGYISLGIGGEYQLGGIRAFQSDYITYDEYYSPALFHNISTYIGKPLDSYRTVSIGMHPAVSQYNGFYTLDAYQYNYPIEYKQEFRKIIAKELDKNDVIKNYFDYFGSRCYVYTNETGLNGLITKDKTYPIEHLELNTDQLKKMGGKYIFSAVEIQSCQDNNLNLMNIFEDSQSPWKIWVYEVL